MEFPPGLHPHLFQPINPLARERFDTIYREAFLRCFEYLTVSNVPGSVLEFGTFYGYTASLLAAFIRHFRPRGTELHLYDSFVGLPEIKLAVDQHSYEIQFQHWLEGGMWVPPQIPEQLKRGLSALLSPEQIHVHPGFYEQTLPAALPAGPAALIHIDCDLYASTRTVLEALLEAGSLQDGCLLLFDDYSSNRANPRMGQRRALHEVFAAQTRWRYSEFFSYGWGSWVFFVHDETVGEPLQ